MKRLAPLLLLVVACAAKDALAPWDQLTKDEACAAYVGRKTLLLVADLPVVGTACGVSVRVSGREVVVEVPSKAFRSGNSMRDAAVLDTLGGKERAPLVFTATFPDEALPESVPGSLTIRGRASPLTARLTRELDGAVRVTAVTSFAELGLAAPRLAGGLVVSTHDELTLYARVPSARLPSDISRAD